MYVFDENKMKQLRLEKGLSLSQFARAIRKPRQLIHQWESGNQSPTVGSLLIVMNKFEIPASYFFSKEYPSRTD
jgi:transcriptional regulator with XRE-family HTH domain